MAGSQAHQTIESSVRRQKTEKRLNYERRMAEVLRPRLLAALRETPMVLLTPLGEVHGTHNHVQLLCPCGKTTRSRPQDIFRAGITACKSCAVRKRMKAEAQTELGKARIKRMLELSAARPRREYPEGWKQLRNRCVAARQRCRNGHPNYGGRGIEFRFASSVAMVEWVVEHLGYPQPGVSIDRKDNDGHYEPGNLRWATREEQMLNRRPLSRRPLGERIRRLEAAKPEFCYESLRGFILEGMTDDEIIARQKTTSGRPRVRHTKLRPS